MIATHHRTNLYLTAIAFLAGCMFSPAMQVFFNGDDFYNMYLVHNQNVIEVFKTLFFTRREDFLFYRPLSTQIYFYLGQKFFGLNAFWYHLVSALVFIMIVYCVYRLVLLLTRRYDYALYSTFFYSISPSNFSRLAWITQIQELFLGLFSFLTVIFFLMTLVTRQKKFFILSLLGFILSLTAKESAVMIPLLLLLVAFFLPERNTKKILQFLAPFLLIDFLYLILRFTLIGVSTGQHYFTDFTVWKMMNTSVWYLLWSLGIPEFFVDLKYFNPRTIIESKTAYYFLTDKTDLLVNFSSLFSLLLVIAFFCTLTMIKDNKKSSLCLIFISIAWFLVSLLPHLFSPFHKFPYELTVPLFGVALILGLIVVEMKAYLRGKKYFSTLHLLFLSVFVASSLQSVGTEQGHSWIFQRGKLASSVISFLQREYPEFPSNHSLVFYNDVKETNAIKGISRQVDLAISSYRAIRLFYRNNFLDVGFEDSDSHLNYCTEKRIILASSKFFPN